MKRWGAAASLAAAIAVLLSVQMYLSPQMRDPRLQAAAVVDMFSTTTR
eukprot:CAMPEP_0119284630 /NCGR_PEP_ID=MMETSP1329-20130426/30598_1 /TAXON_ID=114041 /ORGANISM="Genus nov. species nov., Strain RCC1024" /LENGTH=47 /DNA_ID= /DNA_START= /DNA_END= /DNA_ORIENTATION=